MAPKSDHDCMIPLLLKRRSIAIFTILAMFCSLPLLATNKSRIAPFDGVERSRVSDGSYGNETLVLNPDSSFRWKHTDGDSRWDRFGVWSIAGDGSTQLRLQYHQRKGEDPLVSVDETVFFSWDASLDLLCVYNGQGLIGFYAANDKLFVYQTAFSASSFLSETVGGQKSSYVPTNLARPEFGSTFWAESQAGPGVGATLHTELQLPDTSSSDNGRPIAIMVMNGVAGNPTLFAKNARLREMSLVYSRQSSYQINLPDTWLPQIIALPGNWGDKTLDLTATAIYSGSKYEDLVVSKLFIFGLLK